MLFYDDLSQNTRHKHSNKIEVGHRVVVVEFLVCRVCAPSEVCTAAKKSINQFPLSISLSRQLVYLTINAKLIRGFYLSQCMMRWSVFSILIAYR